MQVSTGAISGTVTDTAGQPVGGATVVAVDSLGDTASSAITAADGTYTINGLPPQAPADYIRFSAPGYLTQWWNGQYYQFDGTPISIVSPGQTVTGIDAVLASNTTTGALTGTVLSPNGPFGGVSVVATNATTGDETTVDTSPGGHYMLIGLAPGAYTIEFSAPSYITQWWSGKPSQATADQVTVAAGQLVEDIDATLQSALPAAISGTVRNNVGQPVGGATATASCNSGQIVTATTAADGTYTLSGLIASTAPLTCTVGFSATGFVTQWWNQKPSLADADPIGLTGGETRTDISPYLQRVPPPAPSLSGFVFEGHTDMSPTALAGATVVVDNYFGSPVAQTATAADGFWGIGNLGTGVYRVEFQPPAGSGLLGQSWNNEPDLAQSDGISVTAGTPVENINATLTSGSTVAGTVTDTAGPVAGANVSVFTVNFSSYTPGREVAHATTAADGTYSVSGLQAGYYYLLFDPPAGSADVGQWYNDSLTARDAYIITLVASGGAGETATANAQLATGQRGSISGTVTDPSRTPIAGSTVEAVAADGTTTSATTSAADGTYTINNLDVGIYTVWFLPPAGSNYRASVWNAVVGKVLPVTVDQGSNVTGIVGRLSQNGTVSGSVSGPSGPLAGATVTVTNYYGFAEATATTAADGSYSVTGLIPGASRVEFTASGFVTQWFNNEPDLAHSNTLNVPANGSAAVNATLVPTG